jgi:phospholipid transport system substrate-binding protein
MNTMKSWVIGLALLWGAASAFAADSPAPDVILKSVTDETLSIITQDKDVQNGKFDKLFKLAESKVLPHFDFVLMTRSILGRKAWAQATPAQQEALIREFRMLMLNTYVAAYTSYKGFVVEYKPFKLTPGETEATVKSFIRLPGGVEPVPLDFHFQNYPEGWKVFDIDIAGRSMVLARRDEFAPILREGGIDAVIKLLSERNAPKAAQK